MRPTTAIVAATAALLAAQTNAGVIYATGFDDYANGTLAGQTAWTTIGGNWAVSASVNSGQTGFGVMASDGALLPP